MKRAKPIIVANWKGYVQTPEEVKKFVQAIKRFPRLLAACDVMLAPSYTLLSVLAALSKTSRVAVGSQALSPSAGGAHTGDVSALMLKASGASFSIVGHSERRSAPASEDEENIRQQTLRASEAGLGVVLCVGERERDPSGAHFNIIAAQLSSALAALPQKSLGKFMIAYEPVWAIGKTAGEAMQPSDLQEMVIFIRKTLTQTLERAGALRVPILYGGSVEAENIAVLYAEGGVSGFLVGHASAKSESFIGMLQALS